HECFLLQHQHEPGECAAGFVAWHGFDSPLHTHERLPPAHARVAGVSTRIVVLGAGFGGLELSTILSDELGEGAEVTLIDKGGAFVFGYSKLDVMFGRETSEAVH